MRESLKLLFRIPIIMFLLPASCWHQNLSRGTLMSIYPLAICLSITALYQNTHLQQYRRITNIVTFKYDIKNTDSDGGENYTCTRL